MLKHEWMNPPKLKYTCMFVKFHLHRLNERGLYVLNCQKFVEKRTNSCGSKVIMDDWKCAEQCRPEASYYTHK